MAIDQLLIKINNRTIEMRRSLLVANRCPETERLDTLAQIQKNIELAQVDLDNLWALLDDEVNGESVEDEPISSKYGNYDD